MAEFTHFKKDGSAVMVDVHEKPDTYRAASATGTIQVSPEVFAAVRDHTAKKGDVLGVARLAGIMGAKKNAELIPLCHIVPLTNCEVTFTTDENTNSITAVCTTSCVGKTGVEMEALTGVSTALLTIYDMCKAMDRGMVIRDIHILEKDGGKSGHYIYAMGGEVRTALNIVCFPEQMDLNVLGEIMRGGAEKVQEAGGSLSGGHSIADDSVKYGLSVTGTVHPDRIWQNNTGRVGDLLILTKPLGTGILCAAHRVGEENPGGFQKAVESMMTLNKYASETARKYNIHACTDVTGFSFLGHLHEMMESGVSCHIWADQIPVFPGAVEAAEEFLITAAGQRNRNYLEQHVTFKDIPFGMQEVLFDPQTSGGLLMAVDAVDAEKMQRKLLEQGIPAAIVGKVTEPAGTEIYVTQSRKW